ncbi:Piso0_004974 [Millerozyma farinosa CBS 7064]|uniref:Piso0_004974 protein n=1 Tax=Pichia sorbitophila (strain ATCC MYA-4447 / BCRC 22081 / CBS 7064 / NBRC 10061 / NRRL Y-12695) TaxID=559304 RepID=G8Y3W5_PICSO|nr:Piso0_004974 [Millerozyma farinosa CBS 7064]
MPNVAIGTHCTPQAAKFSLQAPSALVRYYLLHGCPFQIPPGCRTYHEYVVVSARRFIQSPETLLLVQSVSVGGVGSFCGRCPPLAAIIVALLRCLWRITQKKKRPRAW